MKNILVLVVGILGLAAVHAGDGYLELINNRQNDWFTDGTCWQGGYDAIQSDSAYRVGTWATLKLKDDAGTTSFANPRTFAGKSLTIGRRANASDGTARGYADLQFLNAQSASFPNDGLFLTWGSIEFNGTVNLLGELTFDGTVSSGTGSYYTRLTPAGKTDIALNVYGSVHSAEGTYLLIEGTGTGSSVVFKGDMSDSYGEIRLCSSTTALVLGYASAMPGTVSVVANGGTLKPSAKTDVVRIGSLKFENEDPVIYVDVDPYTGTNAQYLVNAFSLTDGTKLHVRASHYFVQTNAVPWQTGSSDFYAPLITAPTGVLDPDDFVFDGFDWTTDYDINTGKINEGGIFYRGLHVGRLEVRPSAGGYETLYLVHEPIEYQLKPDAINDTESGATTTAEDGSAWTDGHAPHAGAHYLAKYVPKTLSPDGAAKNGVFATPWDVEDYIFPGRSMTSTYNLLLNSSKSVMFPLLRNRGIVRASRDGLTLKGRYESMSAAPYAGVGSNEFWVAKRAHVNFAAEIFGPGHIDFTSSAVGNWGGASIDGEVELFGTNTAFTGTMTVTAAFRSGYANGNVRLLINDPRNLGASLPAFDFRALELNNKGSLRPRCAMTLADETRGIFVKDEGDFTVPDGVTFAVDTPITYFGVLTKAGAGTLALGRKPRFIDGLEDTLPAAGSNVLAVAAGAIKPTRADALAGLDVRFAAGTGLVFDAAPEDPGMAATGLTSFQNLTAEDKIVISVDPTTVADPSQKFTVTFFTLDTDVAEALLSKCRFTKPFEHVSPRVFTSTEGGKTTVSAEYDRRGLMLILR